MIRRIKVWLYLPLATIGTCLAIIASVGFNMGVDFTGGSLITLSGNLGNIEEVRDVVRRELNLESSVTRGAETQYFVRTSTLDEAQHQQLLTALRETGLVDEELGFESIGPTIGEELRRKAVTALLLVAGAIVLYLAYTFRQATGFIAPWKFGLAALYALLHDLLVVAALFVVLGKVLDVTIDTLFVTAMLVLLGYSVNDTIVIFNRLQSDWVSGRGKDLLTILDGATAGSVRRSLNTSWTTLLVLGALLWLGGASLTWFIVALIAGVIVGTYSSLFVAPPLLYYLAKK